MNVEVKFFAQIREAAGETVVELEFDDGATVGDVLEVVREEFPQLELLDDDGDVRGNLNVMRNDRNVAYLDGIDTELEDGDRLNVFSPVSGG